MTRDPLTAALQAHTEVERAAEVVAGWVRGVALLGLPLWALCLWPEWFSPVTRRLVLSLWALCGLGTLGSLVAHHRARQALVRRADRLAAREAPSARARGAV